MQEVTSLILPQFVSYFRSTTQMFMRFEGSRSSPQSAKFRLHGCLFNFDWFSRIFWKYLNGITPFHRVIDSRVRGVYSSFKTRVDVSLCMLHHMCRIDSSDSPLVQQFLISWWPVWHQSYFDPHTCTRRYKHCCDRVSCRVRIVPYSSHSPFTDAHEHREGCL